MLKRTLHTLEKSQGRVIVLGSGWAGFRFIKGMSRDKFDVVTVSPRNYFIFTPLLASTAVGTLEHRCIVEPLRYHCPDVSVYEAECTSVDFDRRVVHCRSSIGPTSARKEYELEWDHLVMAFGCVSNTFNIPGVKDYAYFLKDISDAQRIRSRVVECFELASQPGVSSSEQSQLLHFATVGGGPTGIEFSAELHDFITEDMAHLYPELARKVTMSVYDAAPKILSSFDENLSSYAMTRFARKGIKLRMQTGVKSVSADSLTLTSGEVVPFGLLVWSTGLAPVDLVRSCPSISSTVKMDKQTRILTDAHLRVLNKDSGLPLQGVYAVGDCATIMDQPLPATAQVAKQKAIYLAKAFKKLAHNPLESDISKLHKPFSYAHMGTMAYVGGWSAIVDFKGVSKNTAPMNNSGPGAWLFWRSAYFTMSVSAKNKILIPMFWFLTWIFGRDISRFKGRV